MGRIDRVRQPERADQALRTIAQGKNDQRLQDTCQLGS
jgi:hypothetical protein